MNHLHTCIQTEMIAAYYLFVSVDQFVNSTLEPSGTEKQTLYCTYVSKYNLTVKSLSWNSDIISGINLF